MATKTIAWQTGSGNITLTYTGQGDGTIAVQSDSNNLYEARSAQFTVRTIDGSNIERTITISQAAKVKIDISTAIVTAANQTYNGSAKTPTPTVTLNGETIPSSGYDVAYSDNTNAGTATITVTGKGDYTGTATGSFIINKASRTISFTNTYYVQNTSTTTTRTATPSAGSSDGAITYSISSTTYATINSSSGAVTSKTSDGSATVTATIAEGTNYLSASTSYTLYVFATTHNYSYSGSYSSVTLPPGTYQFQCWGAQGGSNAAYSTYGITAKAGGKGGYSVGQLTVSEATGVRVYVGGQGSSSSGGYNGGGSTTGTSQYNSSNTLGYSKMGGGGGATDIRLSDGALLSRMIVAGGGSGGAMCYKKETTSSTITDVSVSGNQSIIVENYYDNRYFAVDVPISTANTYKLTCNFTGLDLWVEYTASSGSRGASASISQVSLKDAGVAPSTYTLAIPSNARYINIFTSIPNDFSGASLSMTHTETSTYTNNNSQIGFVGGGTTGGGYSTTYVGKQDSAGSNGSFGAGANQSSTNYRYCSGAGGGGWYGGGSAYSDSTMSYVRYMGGGSGWVNTSASSGNRPSGYTGLQLDSGTTYKGDTSFPSTSGSTETGHSGNGYARITRL